jgi:hypothetical protein
MRRIYTKRGRSLIAVNNTRIQGRNQNEKNGIRTPTIAIIIGCTDDPKIYAIDTDITYKNKRAASATVPQRAQGRDSDAIVSYDENTTFPIPPRIRKKL